MGSSSAASVTSLKAQLDAVRHPGSCQQRNKVARRTVSSSVPPRKTPRGGHHRERTAPVISSSPLKSGNRGVVRGGATSASRVVIATTTSPSKSNSRASIRSSAASTSPLAVVVTTTSPHKQEQNPSPPKCTPSKPKLRLRKSGSAVRGESRNYPAAAARSPSQGSEQGSQGPQASHIEMARTPRNSPAAAQAIPILGNEEVKKADGE